MKLRRLGIWFMGAALFLSSIAMVETTKLTWVTLEENTLRQKVTAFVAGALSVDQAFAQTQQSTPREMTRPGRLQ